MALWDFVKDAGRSIFGEAQAAEPAKSAEQQETERKVAALEGELKRLGLNNGEVHLTLRGGGDTVRIDAPKADRETMEKLILAIGNIKGIAKVEADLPPRPVPAGAAAAAEPARPVTSAAQTGQAAAAPQAAAPAAPAPAPAQPAEDDAPVFHTVEKGDTLSAIARKYLGDANKYHQIFEANKPMLKDPDEIYPGQVLRIPGA